MNFVVVASSPAVLSLADAVAQSPAATALAHWCPDEHLSSQILERLPNSRSSPSWDDLLAIEANAAIICGNVPSVTEAARQLAVLGRSLLVVLDPALPPALQFDLSGIWHDRTVTIVPAVASGVGARAAEQLRQWQSQNADPPRRIDFQRVLPPDSEEGTALSEEDIDRHLFRDAFVLRQLGGEFDDVTSLRSGSRGQLSDLATVTLSGQAGRDVTWSLQRGPDPVCRIAMHGGSGTLEWKGDPRSGVAADAAWELRAFMETRAPVYSWLDLIRSGELAAAAKTSIKKRRTIQLRADESTERSQFKSQMTAVGCAVLTWALLGSVLLMFTATVIDPRDPEYKAAAAYDFVLRREEFIPRSEDLRPAGRDHLITIARRWSQTDAAVIVEAAPSATGKLDQARRQVVVQKLRDAGVREPAPRVIVRPLSGQLYEALLRLGWLVALVPLLLFLAFQGLIVAARGKHGAGEHGQPAHSPR